MEGTTPTANDLLDIQTILGRGADFVGGIDNEALDFSQLEDFINSEGSQGNNTYFGESLNTQPHQQPPPPPQQHQPQQQQQTGKLLNVIVENKRTTNGLVVVQATSGNGHSLPESPPDSSSEHPYSPQENNAQEHIYTTLGGAPDMYKLNTSLLNDSLILANHIVIDQNHQGQPPPQQPNGTNGAPTYGHPDAVATVTGGLLMPETSEGFAHLGYDVGRNVTAVGGGDGGAGLVDGIASVYADLQSAPKKRKLSQDSTLVKSEPVLPDHTSTSQLSPQGASSASMDEEYASSEACLSESQYQCIRFNSFQQVQWHSLCDQNLTELPVPYYRVDADKGFNFSNADDAFVCQKKNHFQITCHVQLLGDVQFVKTPDGFQKISSFYLHFYGVKHDCPTQTIRVEQSQSDRSKKPFHPVLVELMTSKVTKVTVGRLHFSETTSNNMRKKGKPNPEQRYFQLVVGLHAHTTTGNFPVISHASQKIIVRASNPGQFESDVELCWQKGQTQDSIFHNGKVGIHTDRPDESLVVHGNIKVTGHIIQPSDIRAKKNIIECDPAEQLRNVQKLRVVRYDYEPTFASQLSRNSQQSDTGVIAQEVAKVLPEAVRPAGDLILDNGTSIDNFLVVNKERIFMENIGAVKELCRVTDNLETRIDQLERINRRLNKLKRGDSLKSTSTVSSVKTTHSSKCSKHHSKYGENDEELCSNKFIQIIIVALVLIMAFCLAAITTLYLMEAARHNKFTHTNIQSTYNHNLVTKRPPKLSKNYISRHTVSPYHFPDDTLKNDDVTQITVDSSLIQKPSYIIGRPSECHSVEQDLESSNLCQIYCCSASAASVLPPPELGAPIFTDKQSSITMTANNKSQEQPQAGPSILDKTNEIAKPFQSNDIDKQIRQRRDAYDLTGETNTFDTSTDDKVFRITIQGRDFNTTLTQIYLESFSTSSNLSYTVPISKYMPDDFVNLIFRSLQPDLKEIQLCYNEHKRRECPYVVPKSHYEDEKQLNKPRRHDHQTNEHHHPATTSTTNNKVHKVNEYSSSQLLGNRVRTIFEVNTSDFQTKLMSYRVLVSSSLPLTLLKENVCKLTDDRLGIDFVEYNFYFYRRCDE